MAHDLKKKWRSKDVQLHERADFSVMLLSDRVLSGLTKAGFKTPSPIQLEAIPIGRFGKDLLVQAKSGTGKTLVFTIVALEMLKPKLFRPQVLVLAPTREIAAQICSVIKSVGSSFHKLTCYSFIGGLPVVEDKERALTCQIAVGTPGRVKQLITLGSMPTNSIRLLVFDEADELLQGTFKMEIDEIFKCLPKDKQVIATSATYPPRLRKIIFQYLKDPFIACLNATELALLGIVHYTKVVSSSLMPLLEYKNKLAALEQLLTKLKFCQCLVFCNMISRVEVLCKDIRKWGFSTAYISSAKEQSERLKAIDRLKHFKCKVLVSSDVSSRGIDAENVDLVVNFDLALTTETYLHRVGRAGRYGSIGLAVSILTEKQLFSLKKIEREAAFKSYKLPEPLPKDLIRNPSFGEYTFEIEESAQGVDEGHEEIEVNVQPIDCDSGELFPNEDVLKEKYAVELKHTITEEIDKNVVETASKNSCGIVVDAYNAQNDGVIKENEPLTIVQKLEKVNPEMKNCISLFKNLADVTDKTNGTNGNANSDSNNSFDKGTLSNDSNCIKKCELKKVSFAADNKPFDMIETLENPETKNSIACIEVSQVTNELNDTNINSDLISCSEKDIVIEDSSYEKCFETNNDNGEEVFNTSEMYTADNVNNKLNDLIDNATQSSEVNEVDGKESGVHDEKCFAKEENDAVSDLNEINFSVKNYILDYENKFLPNESMNCSDVPSNESGISNDMVNNLLSEKRSYIYNVFKEYEKCNSVLKVPVEVQLEANQTVLNSDFKIQVDERSNDLKNECKERCPESLCIPQKVCNISEDQGGKESKDCGQNSNADFESARPSEIWNDKYEKNMIESVDSNDEEFQSNCPKSKREFQSTPIAKNNFVHNQIFEESSSENSVSDVVSLPLHSFSIASNVPCNRKFSSDSESYSDSSCDTSSSEKAVKFRKGSKTTRKHDNEQNSLLGVCVPNNFESCDSDSNHLPQAHHQKLLHNDIDTGRSHRGHRQDFLNFQSEYATQQIPNSSHNFHFAQSSMPSRHHHQPMSYQHCTCHCQQTTCEPRHGLRGIHPPSRCQRYARLSGLHCTRGATRCYTSSRSNYHHPSNTASNGRYRPDTPCCSSTAYTSPYDIFYQQWQYLQRCMNAPF